MWRLFEFCLLLHRLDNINNKILCNIIIKCYRIFIYLWHLQSLRWLCHDLTLTHIPISSAYKQTKQNNLLFFLRELLYQSEDKKGWIRPRNAEKNENCKYSFLVDPLNTTHTNPQLKAMSWPALLAVCDNLMQRETIIMPHHRWGKSCRGTLVLPLDGHLTMTPAKEKWVTWTDCTNSTESYWQHLERDRERER